MTTQPFSHLDHSGSAQMVNVSNKDITYRTAMSQISVLFPADVYNALKQSGGQTKKGVITEVAKIAGVMAAKKTWDLIPLCHPMMIERCDLDFEYHDDKHTLSIIATVAVTHKTGVEMEALTAASVAALTIYDMCKAMSHEIEISGLRLIQKRGGKNDVNLK